ncbi:hypothetical protein ACFE04_009965 [Oxalis oulophora]
MVEVEMLSRLHHPNLVKLANYYSNHHSSQDLLCYKLVSNGSLESWLHGPLEANCPIDWDNIMKITLGATRGFAYLHEDSQSCVSHGDFKERVKILENTSHLPLAYIGVLVHGLHNVAESLTGELGDNVSHLFKEKVLSVMIPPTPVIYSSDWPFLKVIKGIFEDMLDNIRKADMGEDEGTANFIRQVIQATERNMNDVDELNYDFGNPFVTCGEGDFLAVSTQSFFEEIRNEITMLRQELTKYLEVWGNFQVVAEDFEKKDCGDEIDILKTHTYQSTFDGEIKAMAKDFNNKDVDSESEDPEVVITQYDLKTTLVSNHFNGDTQNANVNGTIPGFIGGDVFPSTESLHLASNNFEGELLASSLTLMQMKSLWLNGNVLNGTILILNGMTSLAELWFNGNTFIGPILDVSSLGSMQNFSLRDNGFTGVVQDSLMKFRNLIVINLTDNMLQGQTPNFSKGVVVDMTNGSNSSFCLKDPGTPCGSRVNILLAIASSVGYLKSFAHSWKGITCDSKGNIIVVNCLNMGLTGMISSNFFVIMSLQRIILADKNLNEIIPDSLTTLPSLAMLDVSNNKLQGKLLDKTSITYVLVEKESYLLEISESSSGSVLRDYELSSSKKGFFKYRTHTIKKVVERALKSKIEKRVSSENSSRLAIAGDYYEGPTCRPTIVRSSSNEVPCFVESEVYSYGVVSS